MKLCRSIILSVVCFASTGATINAQTTKPVRSSKRKATLRCSPKRLSRGSRLILDMSVPHGGDLAIVGPDRTFFFVSFWQPDRTSASQSTFDWEKFKSRKRLEIITSQLKATPWAAGRDEKELVFNRTGWYRVLLSENLETDDGTPFSECRVYYVDRN
jgi:hypothetical protein